MGDDVLVEILTRLPLKSFSRSRCVCKSWCRLLSDDYVRSKLPMVVSGIFQKSCSGAKNGKPTYFSTVANIGFEPADLSFLPFYSNSTLVDSCNGLLLFYSSLTFLFHVCNPITKEYTVLPKPPSKKMQLSVLAFDPYRRHHFKVVNFVGWLAQGAQLELFDSESYTWVEHPAVHWGIDTSQLSATIRCIDGVLYILTRHKQMVALNLDSMTCNVIDLPESTTGIENWVGKLGGRIHYGANHEGNKLRVWMLKGKGEWVLKYCVAIKMGNFKVVGFNPEKDVVYMWVGMKLVAYDLGHERVEEVWEGGKEKGHLVHLWVFPFTKYLEDGVPRKVI